MDKRILASLLPGILGGVAARGEPPDAYLAMAADEAVMPLVEFPMGEDIPKEYMSGPWLLAPDWPGIYRMA